MNNIKDDHEEVATETRSVYLFELMVLKDNNSKKMKKKPIMQDFVHFTCCTDLNQYEQDGYLSTKLNSHDYVVE